MSLFYLICAVAGGTVLLCQSLLTLVGWDSHHDVGGHDVASDHGSDAAGSSLFSVLTFRTAVAAVTFFGLAGKAALSAGWPPASTFAAALGAGLGAMLAVHWLMSQLALLRVDGTVPMESLVGHPALVYLKIPAARAGAGKVHLTWNERPLELDGWSAATEIPSGTPVIITGVLANDAVEVAPATEQLAVRG